jgi:uncharacterized membrane protein
LLIARRNCSLDAVERRRAFWLIAIVSAVIAAGFATVGAWLVLPFAGLELVALWVAFRRYALEADDFERVTIRGDRLLLESCTRGRVQRYEWNRYWTQVVVRSAAGGCQVALRAHGREIEFGRCLSGGARLAAARELRDRLRMQ